jgi:acylphosphatase
MDDTIICAHVHIRGFVQGVSFRYYTQREALRLGLHGWVRNLRDGRVEALFEGEKGAVDEMLKWCHGGPPASRVDNVEIMWEEPSGNFSDFRVTYWGG